MSKWDDKSGSHHLKMDKVSRDFTHFKWGNQIFRYNAAAFGIGRVPADYQMTNFVIVNFLRK
jgi:hypothetical protein